MQDRFKFRTYIPDRKFFKFWGWIKKGEYKGLCSTGDYSLDELLEKYTNQCTGLKDKNGKLIYEGDILFEEWKNEVFLNGEKWVVKWNNNHANFYIEIINASKNAIFNQWHLARHDLDYEIIGNIHENKELLESEPTNE